MESYLTVLEPDASDPTDGLSFDPTAESQNPSLQERSCVVHFSRAEFRHLEPALFRIQCDLLCKGVGTAHAPELVSSLQKLVDRKCTASVKGKAPEQSPQTRLADCTLCLELASACLTAFIHEATFIPVGITLSCFQLLNYAIQGFNSIMDETNESTTGLDQAFAHFAQTIRLTAQATVSPDLSPRLLSIVDESLTRVIDTVVLFPHSSPELQNVLAALLSLDNPDLDSFPILSEQHRSQLLSLGAAAPSHLTPDLAQSLQALQNYNPSIDDVEPFAFSSSQAPTSARKRKRDQDLALHKTTARQTSWKPQVQALLGLAAPNVQWASHESLDTVLVKVVQRFTESRNREERASLIHSLGLAACARNGTLEWEPATPFHGAFCPHCDDELSGSAPKKSERALRGVALAALLQVLDASQKLELSAEDLRDILRAICRLLQHTKPAAQKVSSGSDVAKTLSSLLDHPDRLVRISSSWVCCLLFHIL